MSAVYVTGEGWVPATAIDVFHIAAKARAYIAARDEYANVYRRDDARQKLDAAYLELKIAAGIEQETSE